MKANVRHVGIRMVMAAAACGLLALGAATALRAQAPTAAPTTAPASANDAIAALTAEMRALRIDLAQAANASVRSQLLVTRIQLQEQRLLHLDRQRSEFASKLAEAEKMRVMLAGQVQQLERQTAESPDQKERDAARFVIDGMKNQLQAAQANETGLRSEESVLLNSIAAEQGRWSEFNGRLDELERALPSRR